MKRNSPGCCGCAPTTCGTIAVTVNGCPTPPAAPLKVAGAVVTVKQGSTTIGTCTTNSLGQCSIPIAAAGSYTVSVVPPSPRFATPVAQTFSATCTTNSLTFQLNPATGYGCVACCATPIPNNLTLSIGAVTVVMDASGPGFQSPPLYGLRFGCGQFTATGGILFDGNPYFGFPCGVFASSISTPIGFAWDCNGLILYFQGCCNGSLSTGHPALRGGLTCSSPGLSYNYQSTRITGTLASCDPLLWTGTYDFSSGMQDAGCGTFNVADPQFANIWPGSTTFTLSES